MKTLATLLVAALALPLPLAAAAQSGHPAHHDGTGASAQAPMTNGVVKRVDRTAGSVTIAHEALTNLGMPSMTMTFQVKDRTWLDGLKDGTKVRFTAENVNGALTVVALAKDK